MHKKTARSRIVAPIFAILLAGASMLTSYAQFQWEVGMDDDGWPEGDGGGPNASFVQEAGVNPLPGDPMSPEVAAGADDDYYFSGIYTTVIPSNGEYEPVGVVVDNEEAAERAFAGADNDLRYHFNLPLTVSSNDIFSVTFDVFNLDGGAPDPRYGVEVYVNGVLVQPEIVVRTAQLDTPITTAQFSLASVNAGIGPEYDNIVHLKGINYSADGGGAWMGFDYVQFNQATEAIPAPVLPLAVGLDDDLWPTGNGGGTNATFVQENGTLNPLPGSPNSPEVDQQADNDYYFAGLYTNVITANGDYEPVGLVSANEEAAERAFAGTDLEQRYHFNLPNTMLPTDLLAVTFDASNLQTDQADPRFGVEVYFNNVLVQSEILIRTNNLGTDYTTAPFSLASVNAIVGSGHDNIVTLKGISYSAAGGGSWMGIDYSQINPVAPPIPELKLPWSVGMNDNAQPSGNGGGPNTTFVQENGLTNALPGNPASPEVNQQADDDYYFAGDYSIVISGNGSYEPVGTVQKNEEAAERAFAGEDNYLRYHFNLPSDMAPTDQLSVSFDASSLQDDQAEPRYGVEIYVNGVKVQSEVIIGLEQIGTSYSTPVFTLASVNAQTGPGYDNIITLKGINYNAEGGGNWMGIDYVQLNAVVPAPFPLSVGKDDNAQPVGGNGGGPNTSFVQENGSVNPLPGNPANAEVNQQADNDYYFAGTYTSVIPSVAAELGEYEPVGLVLVNEEAAERAFAGSDTDLRYHFNLPSALASTDQMIVSFDALSLDTSGEDPRWGVEVYVNSVKVQEEIIIRQTEFDVDYVTAPFTLASVNAQVGPGADNIVTLRGISYSAEGGGNWMGIDYVNIDPVPKPVFPIDIGKDDNEWPAGDGGGPNATFVQENGVVNDLPGSATSREVAQQADNDYYLAGVYTNVIASNGEYTPIGVIPRNEEAAERAFVPANNELRYHFNLPSTLNPTNQIAVTFDALNLDAPNDVNTDVRYGVEVYFNGVLVQPELLIRTNQLDVDYTTPAFTLASVNAQTGPGADNIVTLKGIDYSAEGGGNWMGIDYVRVHAAGDTGEPAEFVTPITLADGRITLSWTGTGNLEWAPSLLGPWTPITPAPTSLYSEAIVPGANRFYRLRQP